MSIFQANNIDFMYKIIILLKNKKKGDIVEKKIEKLYSILFSVGNLLQPVPSKRKFSIVEKGSSIVAGPFEFSDGIFKILYENKQKVGTNQPLVYVKKNIDGEDRLIRSIIPMGPVASGLRRSSLVEYSPRGPKAGGSPAKIMDLAIWESILNPNAEIYLGFELEKNPQN